MSHWDGDEDWHCARCDRPSGMMGCGNDPTCLKIEAEREAERRKDLERVLTPAEFLDKIWYEGGVKEALDYGLTADNIDDSDPSFKELWRALHKAWKEFENRM